MRRSQTTGNSILRRKRLFQTDDGDVEIPDGDVQYGKSVFANNCTGCHEMQRNLLAPMLYNIYGKTSGTQKGFKFYSKRCRQLGYKWSKEKLFNLLGKLIVYAANPEEVLSLESGMTFAGLVSNYDRASVIEYLHYVRITDAPLLRSEWVD